MGFVLVSGSFDRLNEPNSILLSEDFAKAHGIELDDVIQGANNRSLTVLGMFVGQYVKMVLVAFLFAAPVSYLIMSRWLEGFAYHIPLYWWVFLIALAIVLAVTSAIVVARAYRAAKEDPVGRCIRSRDLSLYTSLLMIYARCRVFPSVEVRGQ